MDQAGWSWAAPTPEAQEDVSGDRSNTAVPRWIFDGEALRVAGGEYKITLPATSTTVYNTVVINATQFGGDGVYLLSYRAKQDPSNKAAYDSGLGADFDRHVSCTEPCPGVPPSTCAHAHMRTRARAHTHTHARARAHAHAHAGVRAPLQRHGACA